MAIAHSKAPAAGKPRTSTLGAKPGSKSIPAKLAILGGAPAFAEPLHVGRPNTGDRERFLQRVNDILDRRWLTNNGLYVQEFEQRLQSLTGAKHCIAVCNGTLALQLSIRALSLTGEAIVPAFTFAATAHALLWEHVTPVFCDVDPDTHNIDPARIESLITDKTSAIVAVHLWGRPAPIEALTSLASKHRLRLIFDAAHAIACSADGRMIGNFGDAEIFSFHATKVVNTFEGGAVATNDDALATKVRLMRNFGFQGFDNVTSLGTNAKMNEMSAAMGLTGLDNLEPFVAANRQNYERYRDRLSALPGVKVVAYNVAEACNYQYTVLEIDESAAGLSRDQLLQVLQAENVLARRYFYPGVHRMEPYRGWPSCDPVFFPGTESVGAKVLVLPTGTSVRAADADRICDIMALAIRSSDEVGRRLPRRG